MMNRNLIFEDTCCVSRRVIGAVCGMFFVLGMSTFAIASEPQRPHAFGTSRASVGDMTSEEIATTVEDLLKSEDPAVVMSAVRLASMGGRRLSGTPVVDKLRAYFDEAPDANMKYAVVNALAAIAGPQDRTFFSGLLQTKEPVSSRIRAVDYLIGDMNLLRDEVEPALLTLLEGLACPAGNGPYRRPLETWAAWATLDHMVGRYHLPVIEPAGSTPDERAKAAAEWWLREREAVLQRFPQGPKLLKIGRPTPHKVYDWDEGVALICRLIESSEQAATREGIGTAMEAGDQLRATRVVQSLMTLSTRPSDDPPAVAIQLRRKVMLALAAIDDPASRAWFVSQLDSSESLILRLLAARHLSAGVKASEANQVIGVLFDAVKVADDDSFYRNNRMREEVRRVVDEALSNVAEAMKTPKLEVDWQQNRDARGESVRAWWDGARTKPADGTQTRPADATQTQPADATPSRATP